MEVERSTKHRSLGIDSNPQSARTIRPSLGGRHKSAPLVPQAYAGHTQSLSGSIGPREFIAIQESLRNGSTNSTPDRCLTVNLVVLGKPRVGKSTFIRGAFNLGDAIPTRLVSNSVSIHGTKFRIQFCEVGLNEVEFSNRQSFSWPTTVGDVQFPQVDGILWLYDVTNEKSVAGIPKTLPILSKSNLPIMLIACKVDAHISEQEVGIAFVERIRRSFPSVTFGESSSTSSDSAKRCLRAALNVVSTNTKSMASQVETFNGVSQPAVIEIGMPDIEENLSMPTDALATTSEADQSPDGALSLRPAVSAPETLESYHHNNMLQAHSQILSDDDVALHTFLDIEDTSDSSSESSDLSEPQLEKLGLGETNRSSGGGGGDSGTGDDEGTTFSDLVDRLLQMPTTKNDSKFVPAFLCLYRSFATPRRLLVEIIDRFVFTNQSDLVPLTKVAELLRYLQVLAQWTAVYPGDFAESATRRLAIQFAQDLEQSRNFAPAAREIIGNLLTIIMDDDRDWAYDDDADHDRVHSTRAKRTSFLDEKRKSSQSAESDDSDNDKSERRRSLRNSSSTTQSSSIVRLSMASSQSQSATNLANLDSARDQSKLFKSIPTIPLSKLHWHQFMAMPTEELAQEITRMDWTMYSGIRARDFVRHVSLSSKKRALLRHSDTIGMMVKHFNHLALFVSGMILLRDKPKHRAKMLEKFMDLAWKVRQLNNYNSLGAIVAGITGPEIARLAQTHELVPSEVKKQFLRLTVLMSISRSYSAYRMAWDNSFTERIPFIPLVRQDLTMAANANKTFIGKNINWRKFKIMGDVIVGIQKSHEQPYTFPDRTARSQEITRLILETKVIEESEDSADPRGELYDRSVQLEPQSAIESRRSLAGLGVRKTMTGWF